MARLVVASPRLATARRLSSRYPGGYDETLLRERGKCDVRDWPSAGPSFGECDTLCDAAQSVRGRGSSCKMTAAPVRRLPSTTAATACCWLLVALGVSQVSISGGARGARAHGNPLGIPRRFKRAS